jgi:hypothetical protein
MPIPELLAFQTSTAQEGKLEKRGNKFVMVDAAIEAWEDARRSGSLKKQIGALYQIMKEAAKLNKKIKPKGSVGKKNALAHRRKFKLEELYNSALQQLDELAPHIERGLARFEERKQFGPRGNVIALSGGYRNERAHYLSTGKRFAYAGSNAADTHVGLRYQNELSKQLQKLHRKSFESLTVMDFEFLAEYGGNHLVTYYNKIARLKYMIVPDGMGGFEDLKGSPVHMNTWYKRWVKLWMYAIDRYGNLFVKPAPDGRQDPEGYLNHSSFNAGKEVMCAGCIWIANGSLRHIDNNSGHYKPSAEQLREAVSYLFDEGIDISRCRLIDVTGPKGPGGIRLEYYAASWLNGTRIPDYTEDDERANGLMVG